MGRLARSSVLRRIGVATALCLATLGAAPFNHGALDIAAIAPTTMNITSAASVQQIKIAFKLPLLAAAPGESPLARYQTFVCFQPTGRESSRCDEWYGDVPICSPCSAAAPAPSGYSVNIDGSRLTSSGRLMVWVFYKLPDGSAVSGNAPPVIIPVVMSAPAVVPRTPSPAPATATPIALHARTGPSLGSLGPKVALAPETSTTYFIICRGGVRPVVMPTEADYWTSYGDPKHRTFSLGQQVSIVDGSIVDKPVGVFHRITPVGDYAGRRAAWVIGGCLSDSPPS